MPRPAAPEAHADRLPMLAALVANLLLGAAIAATRFVVHDTGPLTLAFLRYAIATASLLPFLLWRRPALPPPRDLVLLGLLGVLLFGLFPITYNASLTYTFATRAAVVFALVPLLTLALAALLRYEAFTPRKLAGTLLGLAGVALALGDRAALREAPPTVWLGDGLMFVTVCLGASYNVLSRRPLQRQPALVAAVASLLPGTAFLAAVAWLAGAPLAWPALTPAGHAAVLFTGIAGGSLGYVLFLWALRHTTPTRVAVFVPLNPIAASALAAVLLHEPAGPSLLAGLACVTAGILLVNWPWARRAVLSTG
jgi:drug/metabolite transporter (DMT)-like permease